MSYKIIVMPDSFKGSMSSKEVCDIISDEANKCGIDTVRLPIADGGEGSIECILNILGGDRVYCDVIGPGGNKITAYYGVTKQGTAVIEIAESSGITKQDSLHPVTSNTYGFGELIKDALAKGYKDFLLCLGGSATTDCGCGMAAALGAEFYNSNGDDIIPSGETLADVDRIDLTHLDSRIEGCNIRVMSDVENPLYGAKGAAYIFSPQKGASKEEVVLLDKGLEHVSKLIEKETGVSSKCVKGAGAAGGAGYGCASFLKAEIVSGINAILDIAEFDKKVKDCDLIVTGEGKLDAQSLMGKVLSGIKKRSLNKRIVSFCGICDCDGAILKKENITAIEIGRNIPIDESIKNGAIYLKETASKYFKDWTKGNAI